MSLDHNKTSQDPRVDTVAAYLSHYPITEDEIARSGENTLLQEAVDELTVQKIANFTAAEIAKNPADRSHYDDVIFLVEEAIYETLKTRLEEGETHIDLDKTWDRASFVLQEVLRELAWIRGQSEPAPVEETRDPAEIMDELGREVAAIRRSLPKGIVEELLGEEIA